MKQTKKEKEKIVQQEKYRVEINKGNDSNKTVKVGKKNERNVKESKKFSVIVNCIYMDEQKITDRQIDRYVQIARAKIDYKIETNRQYI